MIHQTVVLAASTLALIAASSASPQQASYAPSQEARSRTLLDKRTVLPRDGLHNYPAAEVQAYRAVERQIVDKLMTIPAISRPTNGLCTQVGTWADVQSEMMPILGGTVRAVLPSVIDGRCTKLEGAGVEFELNGFRAMHTTQRDKFRMKGNVQFPRSGIIELGDQESGQILIVHKLGVSPVKPMLARDFLTASIAEARGQLAKIAGDGFGLRKVLEDQIAAREAERARAGADQQACYKDGTADQEVDLDDCRPENRVWAIDPAYFNKAGSGAVRLIVVSTDPAPQRFEKPAAMNTRLAIWRAIDPAWLQTLVQ